MGFYQIRVQVSTICLNKKRSNTRINYITTRLAAVTKNLKTDYTIFDKPICFLLIRGIKDRNIRSSLQRSFMKKGAHRNFAKFTLKHLGQGLSFPATFFKKGRRYRRFPMNFAKFLRTPFLQNMCGVGAVVQRCSVKKGVLKNFEKFTGKHLCQSLFFNKVAGWDL